MPALRRVAVLGATGSVGRQVCPAFARRGYDVVAVARRPAAHLRGHRFLALDVTAAEPAVTAGLLAGEGVGVVVNAAGRWGPTEAEMVYSHSRLVARLLAALALLPDPPRLVHLGSIHEYGPVPEGTPIDEALPPRPANPYARTKLEGSQAVLDAGRAGQVDGVVLRAVNMWGPHPPQETFFAGLLRRLRRAAETGEPLRVGVADARRDFVDVRDVAEAVVRAAEAPAAGGRAVNIGSGEAVAVHRLVALVLAASGVPPGAVRIVREQVPSKGGAWVRADIRLAERLLGWRPTFSPRESAAAMVAAAGTAYRRRPR
ncbi:NAD-dependent epimerase/dehydratase family protein [Spirillospora sp. NPDC050679]